ncbi:Hypothetical predicted protein [Mytilus galloprovincialis]|uniref:Uncharacterized protein n=1 Tax=Mytilus galloprovincialis TaxID=29158 RepID=A0A8B6C9H4_MYTGA|nr:Hypothetical predicted protein [Mytilus galloprovincialis]
MRHVQRRDGALATLTVLYVTHVVTSLRTLRRGPDRKKGRHPAKMNTGNNSQMLADDLALSIFDEDPSIMLKNVDRNSQTEIQGFHPRLESNASSWCVCTKCREMPTGGDKML